METGDISVSLSVCLWDVVLPVGNRIRSLFWITTGLSDRLNMGIQARESSVFISARFLSSPLLYLALRHVSCMRLDYKRSFRERVLLKTETQAHLLIPQRSLQRWCTACILSSALWRAKEKKKDTGKKKKEQLNIHIWRLEACLDQSYIYS